MAVRTAVVVSIGVLLPSGPTGSANMPRPPLRYSWRHGVCAFAAGQSAAGGAAHPLLVARHGLDSVFTFALIALTGGVYSPVVSVLVLVVIASAARLSLDRDAAGRRAARRGVRSRRADVVAPIPVAATPVLRAGWSALYLLFVAIITAGLSALAEREHRSRVRALVEAEAEHAAAEEERDLRARLLRSYESQQDGLQVLLHEFRTPVTSLEALTEALTARARCRRPTGRQPAAGGPARPPSGRHARCALRRSAEPPPDLLGRTGAPRGYRRALSSRPPTRSVWRPPRLQLSVGGDVGAVLVNAQGLRRVLTNLLENASRHGRGEPVDVTCARDGDDLVIAVLDRGPGIPPTASAS